MRPPKVTKLLLDRGIINGDVLTVTSDRITFDASAVATLVDDLSQPMNLSEAVAYLRLPKGCREDVGQPWFPKPVVAVEATRYNVFAFSRRDLDRFAAELAARANRHLRMLPGSSTSATLPP